MQLHVHSVPSDPARDLTRDIPRDQALGLRLIALARAAAGLHMACTGLSATLGATAHEADPDAHLLRSQAARLARLSPTPESAP